MGYGLDDRGGGGRVSTGAGNLSHPHIKTASWAHSASYPLGTGALSLGVKRPGREADRSTLFNAEVKDAWIYTSTPPVHLQSVVPS
jgi:hypothetical protein